MDSSAADALVVVPNSHPLKNPVEVLTHRGIRRATIITGVAYDVDVEQAVNVIRDAVSGCQSVSPQEEIQVFPQEFGSSSVNIQVAWWCGATPLGQRRSRGEVVTAIKAALDAAGLEIPFPYRRMTFKEPLQIDRLARRHRSVLDGDVLAAGDFTEIELRSDFESPQVGCAFLLR